MAWPYIWTTVWYLFSPTHLTTLLQIWSHLSYINSEGTTERFALTEHFGPYESDFFEI